MKICTSSCTACVKLVSVACGSAPSLTLVSRLFLSKPLSVASSGPSATVTVSRDSATLSDAALSVSLAVCTGLTPSPEKSTRGVRVEPPITTTP